MSSGLLLKLEKELKLRNYSKNTIKGYLFSVKKFLKYSSDKGISERIFRDYILKKLDNQNPSTVAKDLFAIKFFFEKILKQKVNIPKPKRNKTLPNILTIEELKKMLDLTKNPKHKLIIKLLYGCGFRVSEIINLKKQDVNFEEDLIKVNLGKGKKDRFVKIPFSIKEDLENYSKINNSKILFLSNHGGKLTIKSIQKIVSNAGKKAKESN